LIVSEHLWKRWRDEYFSTLRRWRCNHRSYSSPSIGDLVLSTRNRFLVLDGL
jgi:hypothetical protein